MRAVMLLGFAACGATSTPVVGNRAAPPPKPPCTEDRVAAIEAHLQARWNTRDAPVVRCTPGRFPTPGFYVIADDRIGVLEGDGVTELVPLARARDVTGIIECATVDLDGDGVDEIVETKHEITASGSTQWLDVLRITERGTLARIRGPHTTVEHRDLGRCDAHVRLAGQTIVVMVARSEGLAPSDCLGAGTHTFALDRRAIVEIDATRVSRR